MVTFAVQILEYCISYNLINFETVEFWNSREPQNFLKICILKSKDSSSSIFTKLASIYIFWWESDSHKENFLLFIFPKAIVFHRFRAFDENFKYEDHHVQLKKDFTVELALPFVMIALR